MGAKGDAYHDDRGTPDIERDIGHHFGRFPSGVAPIASTVRHHARHPQHRLAATI